MEKLLVSAPGTCTRRQWMNGQWKISTAFNCYLTYRQYCHKHCHADDLGSAESSVSLYANVTSVYICHILKTPPPALDVDWCDPGKSDWSCQSRIRAFEANCPACEGPCKDKPHAGDKLISNSPPSLNGYYEQNGITLSHDLVTCMPGPGLMSCSHANVAAYPHFQPTRSY